MVNSHIYMINEVLYGLLPAIYVIPSFTDDYHGSQLWCAGMAGIHEHISYQ